MSSQQNKTPGEKLSARVNPALRAYIEEKIFPEYAKNDWGHHLEHILYVIRRSFQFAATLPADQNINPDIVYAVAAYHDIGHHIDAKHHEQISAQMFREDPKMRQFFSAADHKTVAEAIEDHRSVLDHPQRSIYGKIVASADCQIDVEVMLHRTFTYRLRNFGGRSLDDIIEESRQHLASKYGHEGYGRNKMFFDDPEFDASMRALQDLVYDPERFRERYIETNHLARSVALERELAGYLESVNPQLRRYVEDEILPQYAQNDRAHGILHIREVIRRAFRLNQAFSLQLDPDLIYAAAAYHDLGKHINSDRHEMISADLFRQDQTTAKFFAADQLQLIAEAIEDHRSSKSDHPRSVYGELLSSADRNTRVEMVFVRSFFVGKDRQPDSTVADFLDYTFHRLAKRYSEDDPENMFFADAEYRDFLAEIRQLLRDKDTFAQRYCEVNQIGSREHTLAAEHGPEISPVVLI